MLQIEEPCDKFIFGKTIRIKLFDFPKGFLEENLVLEGWNLISLFDILHSKGTSAATFGRHGAIQQSERKRIGARLLLGVAKPYEGIIPREPLVAQERRRCAKCIPAVQKWRKAFPSFGKV
jgi:hypothetical protein